MYKYLYKILDRFFQNNFIQDLIPLFNDNMENLVVFDVGCYVGNFSRKLKNEMINKNIDFHLFDPNHHLFYHKSPPPLSLGHFQMI